jgi:signal transduction histidine kinase
MASTIKNDAKNDAVESWISTFWRRSQVRARDPRFWAVQALVLGIDLVHTSLEARGTMHHASYLYLIPISTYFAPVLYAAMNFGVEGALPTALWCILLTVPNIIFFHHGAERVGVAAQLTLLLVLGVVVASRVDRERRAKLVAEGANRHLAEIQKSLESYIGMALRAQEDERYRLSRELHDETIQDLVVVKVALETLPSDLDRTSHLKAIDTQLQRSIDGIRRFCLALRPSVLDDLGLIPGLEWLLSEMSGRTDIRTTLKVEGKPSALGPDPELAIFRIAQEALRNVERHSGASQVLVGFTYGPGWVRLEVLDDGGGFQHQPLLREEGGLGVVGMQERARLIGATLQISSEPGKTLVSLEVPTNSEATAEPFSERSMIFDSK